MNNKIALPILLLTTLCASTLYSQEDSQPEQSSNSFFEHDFVTNFGANHDDGSSESESPDDYEEYVETPQAIPPTHDDTRLAIDAAKLKAANIQKSRQNNPRPNIVAQSNPAPSYQDEELRSILDPSKIKTVGLIIDGRRLEHAKRNIEKLARLSKITKTHIQNIYLIGDGYKALKNSGALNAVAKDFPMIHRLHEVPTQYQIKRSPTWLFETPEGEIVVEGLDDPLRVLEFQGS